MSARGRLRGTGHHSDRKFAGTGPLAHGAAIQTVEALKNWADPCHKYRHGQATAEPVEPPIELAIILVGNGLNFAGWLTHWN